MRQFIALAAIALSLLAPAHAQQDSPGAYPSRPIRIVVPFAAGGGSDVVARTVGKELSTTLGQPVIIENRPGAGSSVGANYALKSPADGYTLLMASSSYAVNPATYAKLPFDSLNDMTPVIKLAEGPMVVTVNSSLPVRTMKELVAYLKGNPDKVAFGSSGLGGLTHMCAEAFMLSTQTRMVHVPYKGSSDVVPDLVSGRTQLFFADTGTVAAHIATGKLRGLAVSSPKRAPEMPDVPTLAEAGFDSNAFGMVVWQGLLAPRGTPDAIVQKLNRELNRIIRMDSVQQPFAGFYYAPAGGTPKDFLEQIRTDIQRWTMIAQKANVKAQ